MDQSKSQVLRIESTKFDIDSSGIQSEDALESLIIYLIAKFGPLTSFKIYELVTCFASHGIINSGSVFEKVVSITLNALMIDKHQLVYRPDDGKWLLNNRNSSYVHNINLENKPLPKLTLRSVSNSEIPIKYQGVGNEFVYVIYQSEARIESILRNTDNWVLKVGRTNNLRRRVAQLSLSGPNSLVVGAAFKTYNSRGLENYIHRYLHDQKKACYIPGRREWFFSNLLEIGNLRSQFEQKYRNVA